MKILVYNVNWRGDVLFSTPALHAIKQQYPNSHLTCLVTPRCREILKFNPDVDEILIFDERKDRSWNRKWELIQDLRKRHFDMGILFHRSLTRALVLALCRIPRRVGYATKGRGLFLTNRMTLPKNVTHKVDLFLNLVGLVGAKKQDRFYRFHIAPEEEKRAQTILEEAGVLPEQKIIVINPGGNWAPKRWAPKRFAELITRLTKGTDCRMVITGAPKDQALGKEISDASEASPVSLCGKTTLGELAAIMRRATLVVANDSGPMHIAVSVGALTLALFGPTDPVFTGPIGKRAHLFLSANGMDAIQTDEVYERAIGLLS